VSRHTSTVHQYEPYPSARTVQEVRILPPYGGPFTLPRKGPGERYTDAEIGQAVARYVAPTADRAGDIITGHSTPDGGRFQWRVVRCDWGLVEVEDLDTGHRYEARP